MKALQNFYVRTKLLFATRKIEIFQKKIEQKIVEITYYSFNYYSKPNTQQVLMLMGSKRKPSTSVKFNASEVLHILDPSRSCLKTTSE